MADGTALWARGFSSTGNTPNGASPFVEPNVLQIDGSGNSYIAGTFSGTTASFGNGVTLNSLINPTGTPTNPGDLFVAKINAVGDTQWVKRFVGEGSEDIRGLTLDGSGNIYIGGSFGAGSIGSSLTFAKAQGSITLSTPVNDGGGGDSFAAKLDPNGNTVWAIKASGVSSDGVSGIAVDTTGVYITGGFSSNGPITFAGSTPVTLTTGSYSSTYVAKLDSGNGGVAWAQKFNDVYIDPNTGMTTQVNRIVGETAYAQSIAVDTTGIYVAGSFVEGLLIGSTATSAGTLLNGKGGRDIFVAKLNANGAVVYAKVYGGTSNDNFLGGGFTLGSDGSQYLAGVTSSSVASFGSTDSLSTATGNFTDHFVAKLTNQGNGIWVQRFQNINFSNTAGTVGNLLGSDGSGNAYIAGKFGSAANLGGATTALSSTGGEDAFVAKLNSADGIPVWAKKYGGTGSDSARGLAVDSTGKSYITGSFFNAGISFDTTPLTTLTGSSSTRTFVTKLDGSNIVAAPKSEIFWRNPNGTEVFWQLENATKLVGAALINSPYNTPTWQLKGVADMDGDGIKDHIYQNVTTRELGYLRFTKTNGQTTGIKAPLTPTFGAFIGGAAVGQAATPGLGWELVGVENVVGTPQADLIFYNSSLDRLVSWETNTTGQIVSSGFFTSVANPTTPQGTTGPNTWKVQTIADFTGDGKADIIWRNAQGATVLWKVNGTLIDLASSQVLPTMATSFELRGVGDFNGDGIKDVVWRDKATNITRFWTFNSSGVATQTADNGAIIGANFQIEAIADSNGDGKSDIVWRDTVGGTSVVWNFNLSGSLAGPTLQIGSILPNSGFIRNFLPGVTNNIPFVNDLSWDIDAANGI
jgi:FG-GAP-like repeat/Beta-propeller repeat